VRFKDGMKRADEQRLLAALSWAMRYVPMTPPPTTWESGWVPAELAQWHANRDAAQRILDELVAGRAQAEPADLA
jgi:hypothetical protein